MRDYCPVKCKYSIPKTAWNRTIWLIRDRDRMKAEADTLLSIDATKYDVAVRKSPKADPVARAVIKREKFLNQVDVIDKALERVPEEYRAGILRHIQGEAFPRDADRVTYSRWKSRYIHDVAEMMGYI